MNKTSAYIKESVRGKSTTIPGRIVNNLCSTYVEFTTPVELKEHITNVIENSSIVDHLKTNNNLTYTVRIVISK